MKKIEYLSNTQRTVLKIQKEINAISNNLSKFKDKDYKTMKKIIHGINYLLAKDAYEKHKINTNENEDNETERTLNNNNNNEYNHNTYNHENNINNLLLLNNQEKNAYKPDKTINKLYFNKKCLSSSKININNTYEDKNININSIKENSQNFKRNNNTECSHYFFNKNNKLTYCKPRKLTQNLKINTHCTHEKNKKNIKKEKKIKNQKYLTLNENYFNNTKRSNKYKKQSIINSLYYNYNENNATCLLKNNFLNNHKKSFSYDHELDIKEKFKNDDYEKEEYDFERDLKLTNKKNLKYYNNKTMQYPIKEFNSYCYANNTINNKYNNNIPFFNFEDEDINDMFEHKMKSKRSNYLVFNDNYNKKNSNENININKTYSNYYTWDINRTQKREKNNHYNISLKLKRNISNISKYNFNSKDSNDSNNSNDIIKEKDKMNKLLNLLNSDNINEALIKIDNLLKYEEDMYKIKEFYNNNKNNEENEKINDDNNIISKIIKNYKKNEKYKNFCQNIMIFHEIKNFESFKLFIKNILPDQKEEKQNEKEYLYINGNRDREQNKENYNCLNDIINNNKINYYSNNKKPITNFKKKIVNTNYKNICENNNDDDIKIRKRYRTINEYMKNYY